MHLLLYSSGFHKFHQLPPGNQNVRFSPMPDIKSSSPLLPTCCALLSHVLTRLKRKPFCPFQIPLQSFGNNFQNRAVLHHLHLIF